MPFKFYSILLLGLSAAGSYAQLGQDADFCDKKWGKPVSGKLDAAGGGLLVYRWHETQIELAFAEGTVFKAVYSQPSMGQADIDSLLEINKSDVEWLQWTPPGIPASEVKSSMWILGEDSAMARFKDDSLSITGHRPSPTKKDPARVVASVDATVPVVKDRQPASKPKPPPETKVVARPAELPGIGDERSVAIKMLGDPQGIMESGSTEILVYAWGSVWVAGNKVISVH
jgi:hypothetical protein